MRTNRSIPNAVVIPELAYSNVSEAAKWLCRAFGFRERLLIANHRAQLSVGESGAIVVMEAPPDTAVDSLHKVIHLGSGSTRPKTLQVTSGLSPRPSQTSTQRNGAAHSSVNETGTSVGSGWTRPRHPQGTRQMIST